MAIVALQRVVQNPNSTEERIGHLLYQACMDHFTEFLGQHGLLIGYTSCAAALAIQQNPNYDTGIVPNIGQFSIMYGMSQLHRGLDPDFNNMHAFIDPARMFSNSNYREEHAEQTVIRMAAHVGAAYYQYNGNCHIYVDFTPCDSCYPCLRAHAQNWYVHYGTPLTQKQEIIKRKKRKRSSTFGRQMEPRRKKAKTLVST